MPANRETPPPDPEPGPLRWVAESPGYPKVLVWDRDRDEWVAGVGAAALYRPDVPTSLVDIERELARRADGEPDAGPGWIGGLRFSVERTPSPPWSAFGAGWWVRPYRWWVRRDGVEREGVEASRIDLESPASSTLHGEPPDAYVDRVREALGELERAALGKIVLARCVRREGRVDAAATLARMARTETGGTLYWIALDAHEGFFGLTPETLYRRRGVEVETEALAGTSGPGVAEGEALLEDPKSLREHAYVRDAIVGALEPLASQLDVAPTPGLHRMARLHHLRTPIAARLHEGQPLLARLHPTPAVCGTPQTAAEAVIARLEVEDRGLYAGAIGWFARDFESIHVALRGARYSGDACIAHLGAGIVRGSVPESELRELELKAEALFESFTESGQEART